ncbi:hypothetical protein [Microbispora sp. NPDC049633]|uniref:hypothetical protein n=1 Tax=Microbispora sp. NPDC049633 TaxID=3154355 RepID=UPI003419EBE1
MDQVLKLPPKAPKPEGPVVLRPEQAWQLYETLYASCHVPDADQETLDALEDRQDQALALLHEVLGGEVTT